MVKRPVACSCALLLLLGGSGPPSSAGPAPAVPIAPPPVEASVAAATVEAAPAAESAPVAEALGPGIVRFHASERARDRAVPYPGLAAEPVPLGPAPAGFPVRPVYTTVQGRSAVRIDLPEGTDLYGTGEVPGPLRRNGRRTVCWNHDAYAYDEGTLHLYQSHPWVLAVRPDGSAFGLLACTSWRTLIDLSAGVLFVADGPAFPLVVIDRESPQAVVRGLAELIGTIPLPPLWALGYHQCRYSYYPADRVRAVARGFRERRLPCDVIWLDIDYMDGFRSFTWSPADFPDPPGLLADLHDEGFRAVAIIDPGIKVDPGYGVYDSGSAIDAWVRTREGGVYTGYVWPGECVFPDFTRADVRRWWADLYGGFLASGLDGIWNDMNEPAIFHVPTKTMPIDNWHRADAALGGPGPHARYHNVYGMLMARGTREGMLAARPDRRPFVLSRANHLGGQRYAAAWTGDNVASWHHLDMSIAMVLNLGLSGQPLCGPDIGGFEGPGNGPMFARWMGFGALFPFARGHTGKGNVDKEPWAFGPEVEATCRRALQTRYRLLPYLYTLQREASETGLPVWRPLLFADPADPELRAVDDAFLIGDDLLVEARTQPWTETPVPLPAGGWEPVEPVPGAAADPDLPRLRLRAGAVLPLGPVIQTTAAARLDTLTLLVALDGTGGAAGALYEDAGDGFGHRQGEFRLTRYEARRDGEGVTVSARVTEGEWPLAERIWNVVVRGAGPSGDDLVVTGPGPRLRLRAPAPPSR